MLRRIAVYVFKSSIYFHCYGCTSGIFPEVKKLFRFHERLISILPNADGFIVFSASLSFCSS